MTISTTTTARVQYNGNGSTTAFSVPFVFSTSADLKVYKTVVATGVETLQTLTTHYTVSGGGGTGSPATGTVTFLSAPASGERVTILRSVPNLQGVDYVENDAFPAQSHELALDKLTLQLQDVKENLTRAILFTPGSTSTNISIGTPVAHALLKWDATSAIITSGFVLPTTNGTSGQVLSTDGAGTLYWANPGAAPTLNLDSLSDVAITSPSSNQLLQYNGSSWVNATVASGGGATVSVTQSSHGFVAGDVLRYNGTAYVKAQADSAANAEVIGIVSAVADANTFTLLTGGQVTGLSGLTAGEVYFLSAATAGAMTVTEPSTTGQISKPIFIAVSTTAGIFYNMRGSQVGSAATVASQSDMESATSTTAIVTPARVQNHPGVAKAWGVVDSTGGLVVGYNISSITDGAAGITTFNFTTAFSSGNFCVITTPTSGSRLFGTASARTTTSVTVWSSNDAGASTDPTTFHMVAYGDQ